MCPVGQLNARNGSGSHPIGHITRAGTLHGLCSREHNPCARLKKFFD
jgi:hypothetical protein